MLPARSAGQQQPCTTKSSSQQLRPKLLGKPVGGNQWPTNGDPMGFQGHWKVQGAFRGPGDPLDGPWEAIGSPVVCQCVGPQRGFQGGPGGFHRIWGSASGSRWVLSWEASFPAASRHGRARGSCRIKKCLLEIMIGSTIRRFELTRMTTLGFRV